MALILRLNRGSTYGTIDLNDVTNYRVLDTWSPRIAVRRVAQFGGNPYQDVVEQIPVYVKASTAALVLEKVEDLVAALEQAYAWKLGAVVDPVLLEFLPQGTSLGAVAQAAVLGTPPDAGNMLEQAQYSLYMTGNSFETLVTIPLIRRGLWLGAVETPTISSKVENPGAMSVTFANNWRIPSPVKLVFGDDGSYTAFAGQHQGFILVADQADKIVKIEAPTSAPSVGGWTTETEAGASGGSFQQINLGTADEADGSGSFTINSGARLFAIFASVLNPSTTYPYLIKARLTSQGFATPYTVPKVLEVGLGGAPDVYPRLEFIGFLATPDTPTSLGIHISSPGATGATEELGLDYWLVMAVDEFTAALAFSNAANNVHRMVDTTLDHRLLTRSQPRLSFLFSAATIDFALRKGDLYVNSVGTNLTAWVVGSDPSTAAWRLQNAGGEIEFTLTATRPRGMLVVR